jgi:hypothetical protein
MERLRTGHCVQWLVHFVDLLEPPILVCQSSYDMPSNIYYEYYLYYLGGAFLFSPCLFTLDGDWSRIPNHGTCMGAAKFISRGFISKRPCRGMYWSETSNTVAAG